MILELLNEILFTFLIYGLVTMAFSMPLSGIQFIKIHKQNGDNESYRSIISNYYGNYGFKIFFRGIVPYTLMNGASSSIYPLAVYVYSFIMQSNLWIGAFILAAIASFFETSVTINLESREILRNKIISRTNMTVFDIVIPVFSRNFIYWFPACICDELASAFNLSFAQVTALSIITGFAAGILSLTVDVYVTRKFGEDERKYNITKFINDIKVIGTHKLFSGAICRGIQIALFTVATSISNYLKVIFLG